MSFHEQIVQIRRIENPAIWEKYSERREKLLRLLRESKQPQLQRLEDIPLSTGPVLTTSTLPTGSVLSREMCTEVNKTLDYRLTRP